MLTPEGQLLPSILLCVNDQQVDPASNPILCRMAPRSRSFLPSAVVKAMGRPASLTEEEKATYEWQMWVPDFGQAGQEKLKAATVLISRVGGLGSVVAYELAAAGVGRMILAHAGNVRPSDLNRQLLMTHASLGQPRVASARRRCWI